MMVEIAFIYRMPETAATAMPTPETAETAATAMLTPETADGHKLNKKVNFIGVHTV